jgi:hypothetical protein
MITATAFGGQTVVLPVNAYAWPEDFGYKCGVQSDVTIVNVMYEQSDATNDVVYVSQIKVANADGGDTTTAIAGTIQTTNIQLESGTATYEQVRTTETVGGGNGSSTQRNVPFVNGSVDLEDQFYLCDLNGAASATLDGGALVVFMKDVDNTTDDSDVRSDIEVFATSLPNSSSGLTLGQRRIIGRNIDERLGTGNGAALPPGNISSFDLEVGYAPKSCNGWYGPKGAGTTAVAAGSATSYESDALHIFFTAARYQNGSSSNALYHRVFKYSARRESTATEGDFGNQFSPAVGDASLTGWVAPTIIDNEVDADATLENGGVDGSTIGIVFRQDGHLFYNEWNGSTWYVTNGVSTPQLIDNESATDVIDTYWGQFPTYCNDLAKMMVFFTKQDWDNLSADVRLYARVRN